MDLEAVVGPPPVPPSLERTRALAALLGDPQDAYPVIHLTGTNGKGSTARMVTALLSAWGLRVGTYTSPDLGRVNERLAVAGRPIDDGALARVLAQVADAEPSLPERPTRFEVLTVAALAWFAEVAVDAAVVEVGLGGARDATNVVHGQVAVVTNVSLDHADVIGPTLADIASEKAGIVEPGAVLVLGETDPSLAAVFRSAGAAQAWERGTEFACEANRIAHGGRLLDLRTPGGRYPEVYLPLHGAHQGDNAACALAGAEAFFASPLPEEVVVNGFGAVRSPGRLEVVARSPLVLLDGAHNPAGARAAASALDEEFRAARRLVVIGVLAGRDPAELLSALQPSGIAMVVACQAPSPRALPSAVVAGAARQLGMTVEEVDVVADAVARARGLAGPEDLVLVTGSLSVVGAARRAVLGSEPSS